MNCQNLFPGKNKKKKRYFKMLSAENFIQCANRKPMLTLIMIPILMPISCLFVLRFYGPVNPMGSCRARSVYLTARLLGRLSPLSG